jgi:hypothetical protein
VTTLVDLKAVASSLPEGYFKTAVFDVVRFLKSGFGERGNHPDYVNTFLPLNLKFAFPDVCITVRMFTDRNETNHIWTDTAGFTHAWNRWLDNVSVAQLELVPSAREMYREWMIHHANKVNCLPFLRWGSSMEAWWERHMENASFSLFFVKTTSHVRTGTHAVVRDHSLYTMEDLYQNAMFFVPYMEEKFKHETKESVLVRMNRWSEVNWTTI